MAALRFDSSQPEALRRLTDSQWEDLLRLCDMLHFTIPLRRVCGDDLPDWVRSRIDRNICDNTLRYERIKAIYIELANTLEARGVDHLVLKGFTHSPAFVDDPRHRMQSDVDLFCPPESILEARDALCNIGYEPYQGFEHQPVDHLPTMMRKTNWSWSGNHFDPEMPVSVDLHFRLWNATTTHLCPKGMDQFWERRVQRRMDNFSFPGLYPVDGVGYAALHVFHHLMGELVPYHVYELARFLHANAENEQFWQEWRELHDVSLRRIEAVCFQLAIAWFVCRVPEQVQEEINSLPTPVQQWFHEYSYSPPSTWTGSNKGSNKDALWLHLSLLESSRDKLFVFCAGLFPVRVPPVRAIRQWPLRAYGRFLKHAVARVGYHLSSLPRTLWQGIRWGRSANELGKQYWIFFAASSFFDIGMFIFFFLYNLFLLDYGYTEKFLGHVMSANALGGVAGAIPGGILAQRFGLRRTMLACLGLVVLFSAALALFVSATPQLCFAFLASAASTAFSVCAAPAIAQVTTEENRPLGFSVNASAGIGLGVFASLAGGTLPRWLARVAPAATSGQLKQGALLVACAIVALAFWPTFRLRFAPVPAVEKKLYPRNPFVFRFLAATAVWTLVAGAFSPFFNAYCAQHLRMPLGQIGVVFAASQLSSMIAILAAPFLFRKLGLVPGIMYTQVAAAVALGFLARTSAITGAATMYVGYSAFLWMSEPGMFTLLMNRVDPSERSGASALNLLVMSLSTAIAASLAGASFARYGYPAVLGVTAAVTFGAACVFRLLVGRDLLPTSQPAPASVRSQS
ncbi:MAG: MFS transporter [Candidatus Sulfotelmatobacter sp.]